MTPNGLARLCLDEGLKLTAYPDPLTHAAPWTIGFGCTGEHINASDVWTLDQAKQQRDARIANIEASLAARWQPFVTIDPVRRDVLVNMAYQMGVSGVLLFHNMLGAMAEGLFSTAASYMQKSLWSEQTSARSSRLAQIMRLGSYPEPLPVIPAEWR